ncbi:MAG: hypothetical protein NVSMB13_10880 [Mycobacteriales bacterium]
MRSLLARGVRSVFGVLWTTRYPVRSAVSADTPPPSLLSDPRVRTAIYSTLLFVVGGLAWLPVSGLEALGVPGPRVPWWVLAPAFAVSEISSCTSRYAARLAPSRCRTSPSYWACSSPPRRPCSQHGW